MQVSVEHFDNQHLEFDQTSDEVKAYTNEIMLTMRDMLKLNPLYKVLKRRRPERTLYCTAECQTSGCAG